MPAVTTAPRWWVSMLVALPVSLGAFSGAYRRTFDAWVHVFFADHYLRGWFETWEPRWYGGFSVLTYPPLAHQLVAACATFFGHEPGFVLVMGATMLAHPFACAAFSKAVLGPTSNTAWVLMTVALWPTSHRFAYVYGQLPLLVATTFALFAMAALANYLRTGHLRDLALMVALVGATAAAHHVSTIFAAMGCGIVGVGQLVSAEKSKRGVTLLRGVIGAIGAAAAIAFAIWPFWKFAAAVPQAEIPHISRDPIWQRPLSMEVIEQLIIVAAGLIGSIYALFKWRRGLGLSFGVLFFGVLSMGFTTPLPALLFRSQAHWLTYDKFLHWSALWLCVLLAPVLARLGTRGAIAITVLLLPASLLQVSHKQADQMQPEFVDDLKPLLAVVNSPDAASYRHLALGFGDQFCRIDIYGQSPNADGNYHTARSDPVLRASGVGALDACKYYPTGKDVLGSVLSRADELSLRWVFVNDAWYYDPVLAAGFELKDVWQNGVTLFEKADVPPIVAKPKEPPTFWGYYWGLAPMTFFFASIALAIFGWLKTRQEDRYASSAA